MDTFAKRIITVVVSLFLLVYVGYQCFQIFYSPVKTEAASHYSVYESVDVDGITIRTETLIHNDTNGYLSYTIDNGNRVSKDGTIAQVFSSEADIIAQQQIDRLTDEIELLNEIKAQCTSNGVQLNTIDDELGRTIGEFAASVNSAYISGMDEWQSKLLTLINKRQLTIGKVADFNDRITALTGQKNAIASSYSPAASSISSPIAGYFVSSLDGYENWASKDSVKSLTTSDIQTELEKKPTVDQTGVVGKVVDDYSWYLACIVPADRAGQLREGSSFNILFPFVTDEVIPATVISAKRDSFGKVAVVFECSYMSGDLSSARIEPVQIQLQKYEGLRVPSRCVITNEQGEQGVYTRVGDTVTFRKVNILYPSEDYVIVEETNDSGYLRLYDDIITEGKNLYDGKTVR